MYVTNRFSDSDMINLNEILDSKEKERRHLLEQKVLLEHTVWYTGKTKIKINPLDNNRHHLPHYHIEGPDADATIDILSGDIIVGECNNRKKIKKEIDAWVLSHRELLLDTWNKYNPNDTFLMEEINI